MEIRAGGTNFHDDDYDDDDDDDDDIFSYSDIFEHLWFLKKIL